MLNLKYKNEKEVYKVEFLKISDNVIQLIGNFPLKNVGFTLSRENNDDNWNYSDYTTIYREIDGGVQFSNNGTFYVEPEHIDILDFSFGLTEEENAKYKIQRQINELKKQLADSDYKVIKNFEAESVGEIYPYDIYELHAERQEIRDKINELENELLSIDN